MDTSLANVCCCQEGTTSPLFWPGSNGKCHHEVCFPMGFPKYESRAVGRLARRLPLPDYRFYFASGVSPRVEFVIAPASSQQLAHEYGICEQHRAERSHVKQKDLPTRQVVE
jgi:hypothetical protein